MLADSLVIVWNVLVVRKLYEQTHTNTSIRKFEGETLAKRANNFYEQFLQKLYVGNLFVLRGIDLHAEKASFSHSLR